ncbi:MAG: radical SAM protein [Bdellovibrionales bacterium]|nr:radical SAM protein [Bdellovibrionales bacterium]
MKAAAKLIENGSFLLSNFNLTPRLINNFFKIIFLNQRPLRTVDLCFDYQCNYKCQHCYAVDFANPKRKGMKLEDYKLAIDKCTKEGAIHFNLVGGEPTMDERLFDVVSHAKKKGAVISLATNGSFLSLDFCQRLKDIKLDVVLLSMDLPDKEDLDNFRKKGCFEDVMSALENCTKVGLKVYISAVMTPESLKNGKTRRMLEFCLKHKILLHTNLPAIMGRWKNATQMFLDEEDKKIVRELYKHRYVRSCEMSSYFKTACRSGWEKLHITEYGDVMPCTFVPIHFGNILTDSLKDIRKKMHDYDLFKGEIEMCIPSTHSEYKKIYEEKISKHKYLPVSHTDI